MDLKWCGTQIYSLFSCLSQASCLLSGHTGETGRGMPTLEILLRDPHSFCFRLGFEFLISYGMVSTFGEFIIHAIWHGNLVKFEKLRSVVWNVTRVHNVDFSIKRAGNKPGYWHVYKKSRYTRSLVCYAGTNIASLGNGSSKPDKFIPGILLSALPVRVVN